MTSEADIRDLLRPMANAIKSHVPDGCGYALFLFHVAGRDNTIYLAHAQRADMFKLLREMVSYIECAPLGTNLFAVGAPPDDQSFATRAFRETMQGPFKRIHRVIRLHTPEKTDFALLLFEWHAGGSLTYVTSVPIDDMLVQVGRWLDHAEAHQS